MKRTMQITALLLALVFSVTDRALAVDVYVLTNSTIGSGAASTSFGTINTSSGAYTEIASLTGDIWNLVWNPSDGNFWVTDGYSTATTLKTLSTSGTLSSAIGTIGKSITGIAWRPTDSTLYGFARGLQNFTGTIDPTTGAWTNLAQIGGIWSNPFGGRLSIMNDTLYFTNNAANSNPSVFGTLNFTATSSFNTISVSNTDNSKTCRSPTTAAPCTGSSAMATPGPSSLTPSM